MLKLFSKYASVGVLNTAIHWSIFLILYTNGIRQAVANFLAFGVAVVFSFFANAQWTFKSNTTPGKFIVYVLFMGLMAVSVGYSADKIDLNPIITLILFSVISLICGFIYSKLVVFRGKK